LAYRNAREGRTACRSIFFLWAVPHRGTLFSLFPLLQLEVKACGEENLSWISRSLHDTLEAAPSSLRIRVRVHATRSERRTHSEGDQESIDSVTDQLLHNDSVSVENGRPNVGAMLEEELTGAKGPVSVDGESSIWDPWNTLKKNHKYDSGWTLCIGGHCAYGAELWNCGA